MLVISLLCLATFFNGAFVAGHFASYTDLAPNFSGTLFGIANTLSGGAMGFVVPTIIALITHVRAMQKKNKFIFV